MNTVTRSGLSGEADGMTDRRNHPSGEAIQLEVVGGNGERSTIAVIRP